MLKIHQFPCLNDNYGYLIHDTVSGETAAIDTPDASRYLSEAESLGWTITAIWNTHWHPDHAGGNLQIKAATGCTITGPHGEADKIPGLDRPVQGGDTVQLGDLTADIINVPGHTLGHIAFHIPSEAVAFVGDAVFALGCGRVFEGDMPMMWSSMQAIKALPPETTLFCAHEYTQANARFAETIETQNDALKAYIAEIDAKRAKGERTVPMRLARELATNPFLRADDPNLQAAMGHPGDAAATFGEIRSRKDRFQMGLARAGDLGANEIIRLLDLKPHPEGGHYTETYRAEAQTRPTSTAIYYLLQADELSAWHRVDADEHWLWHAGGPLAITLSPPDGKGASAHVLGPDLRARQRPQLTIPAHHWQTAETLGAWTLVSCIVAPGFDFSGFLLAPENWRPDI